MESIPSLSDRQMYLTGRYSRKMREKSRCESSSEGKDCREEGRGGGRRGGEVGTQRNTINLPLRLRKKEGIALNMK